MRLKYERGGSPLFGPVLDRAAVTTIQCAERRRLATKSAAKLRHHKAAVAIQRAARSFAYRIHRHAAAEVIQRCARGVTARALAQCLRETRCPAAALQVRRLFRGNKGRRRAVRSMRLARNTGTRPTVHVD